MSQTNGKSKLPKLVTLRDAVERYIASAPDLRSAHKLRYMCNCFEKYGGNIKLPLTTRKIEKFRRAAHDAGRSPATIEGTIGDLLGCLRGTKCTVPDRGRTLQQPHPLAKQPSIDDIGKVYSIARSARFPHRTVDGTRCYDGANGKQQCWREWSDDDRLRFWQTLLVLTVRGGIRMGHFRDLKWEDVGADIIKWRSGRSRCQIGMTLEIKRHLDSVRHLDPIYVIPIAKWSMRYVRRELNRLRRKANLPTWRNVLAKDLPKVYSLAGEPRYPLKTLNADKSGSRWRNWSDDDRYNFWRALLFLSFWTGLRVGDLRRLTWESVSADRIEWRASKTGAPHVFPVTPDVQRHLDMVRGLDSVFVLPIARSSVCYLRDELKRLCLIAGVEPFGLQMVRRASVTEWGCTIEDAGALIHGSGLGVRDYYVNPLKVLARAAQHFELPEPMRDPRKETTPSKPSNGDSFSVSLSLIATLPLSPEEKMESVRRLLSEQTK